MAGKLISSICWLKHEHTIRGQCSFSLFSYSQILKVMVTRPNNFSGKWQTIPLRYYWWDYIILLAKMVTERQQFSHVILYVAERKALCWRQALCLSHKNMHTLALRGTEEKERSGTHTELQMDWNTYAESGSGRKICTCTLIQNLYKSSLSMTHKHKSSFSPQQQQATQATRFPYLHLWQKDTHTGLQSGVLWIIKGIMRGHTEVKRWWARGQPHAPWGKRLTICVCHTHSLTVSSPFCLLFHTALFCCWYCRKLKSLNVWYL